MKHTFSILFFIFASQSVGAASWQGKVFSVQRDQEISFSNLTEQLAKSDLIILGENHSTEAVQDMESQLISAVVERTSSRAQFTLAWEFLSVKDQALIDAQWDLLKNEKISTEQFIEKTVGESFYKTYTPVINTVLGLEGKLLATNLTREEKNPVTQRGISAADPQLVPAGYESGSANYFERFKFQMQGHVSEEKIPNYFDAQCLTDDVMAFQTLKNRDAHKTFLIAGHFHTDYQDGVVRRFAVRAPELMMVNIRIVDASEFTEEQLLSVLRHAEYGEVADYVIYVNEPKIK